MRLAAVALLGLGAALLLAPGADAQLVCTLGVVPPPANDNFASATVIGGVPYSNSASSQCATLEPSENIPCCSAGNSVWYSWTAPFNGTGVADTCGSTFDTVLAVYDGATVASQEITFNDDAPSGPCAGSLQSFVTWECQVGQTYHFQVAHFGGNGGGAYTLNVDGCDGLPPPPCPPPANNCFDNAIPILATPFSSPLVDTTGATTEPGEPTPCGALGSTVWWSWTSDATGIATITTIGSNYDTTIAAYTGTSVGSLTTVACNDDFPNCCLSQIQFPCEEGVTYHIQGGGFNGAQGDLQINLDGCMPAPPPGCGYTILDDVPYDFVDISANPTVTGLPHGDDSEIAVPLPFPFEFCGATYTDVATGSNGYLCFGATPPSSCSEFSPGFLPSTDDPRPALFGYFADLFPAGCSSAASTSCTSWDVIGEAPDRVFIYMMKDVDFFAGPGPLAFEFKLFETTSCFEVHYAYASDPWGYFVVAGYQNEDGTAGYTHSATSPGMDVKEVAWGACPVPPFTAVDDDFTFNEDQTGRALEVLANDVNSAPGPVTITAVGATTLGTVTLANNEITYTPFAHAIGTESFTYTIENSEAAVSTGTVTVTINALNDAPSFAGSTERILAFPGDGTRVVPGWATDVAAAPAGAADELSQEVTFEVASIVNGGIFAGMPEVLRTGTADSMTPASPPVSGAFAMLRFSPSGNSGTSTVCFRAVDSGGVDAATNTWEETVPGVDRSAPQCVEVLMDAPPVAYFRPSHAEPSPGDSVTFDSCPAPAPMCTLDPDGAVVTWLWEFGDGSTSAAQTPHHAFATPGEYVVRLTVWDEHGARATYERTVFVTPRPSAAPEAEPAPQSAPVANAGDDRTVTEGETVQLQGLQVGGSPATTFAWRQVVRAGDPTVTLTGADTPHPRFAAPAAPGMAPVDLLFELRVSDGGLESEPDYVAVRIVSANDAPVAHAGEVQTVQPGELVTLDASGSSDAERNDLAYLWEQLLAPGDVRVQLSDATARNPTFVAPSGPALLRFRLTVSDGMTSSVDHATVEVRAAATQAAPDPPAEPPAVQPAVQHARPTAAPDADLKPILLGALAVALVALVLAVLVHRRMR